MNSSSQDHERSGCACVDVDPGSYDNQVTLAPPAGLLRYNTPEREARETVCVDRCIAAEIEKLWSFGIVTTGCCCGHNKAAGYIGVDAEFIPHMRDLGYKTRPHPDPSRMDNFYPKSVNP